jgi:hypothetical protein
LAAQLDDDLSRKLILCELPEQLPPDEPIRREEIDEAWKVLDTDLDRSLFLQPPQSAFVDPSFHLFAVSREAGQPELPRSSTSASR